jgi:integrase
MSVTVRPYRGTDRWEVDIAFIWSDSTPFRERKRAPMSGKSAAQRWGEERERYLLKMGKPQPTLKEVPTLDAFASQFVDQHCRANRLKPSYIASTESHIEHHLSPTLGPMKLDAIDNAAVQRLKLAMAHLAAKTANNQLVTLSVLLKKAVEWGVIDRMPCTIKLLRAAKTTMAFYDFDEYARLRQAAQTRGIETEIMIVLGGDAGLRLGEIVALEWTDIDFARQRLTVARSSWQGQVGTTKGGRSRMIPMTKRLGALLRAHRHMRSPQVLCPGGHAVTRDQVIKAVRAAERIAVLKYSGVHILRHTFCSHLAMRGATAKAIQELAGHADLATTQRYIHLSPAAVDGAIRLLDAEGAGEMLGNQAVEKLSVAG